MTITATVPRVGNPKRVLTADDDAAIQAALELEARADGAVKRAVLEAARHGASVRVLAERIGRPTSLISRWKRDARDS